MKISTEMVASCVTFYPAKEPKLHMRAPPRARPGTGRLEAGGEMLSNQGLGKTKPTMAKLRNHLQHKEPDGFCLDLLKEKASKEL